MRRRWRDLCMACFGVGIAWNMDGRMGPWRSDGSSLRWKGRLMAHRTDSGVFLEEQAGGRWGRVARRLWVLETT